MAQKTKKTSSRRSTPDLFAGLRVQDGNRRRKLNDWERSDLTAMLAVKERPEALDIGPLIPKGSFAHRLMRYFKDTDASYALPLFKLISVASSWLTQNGAVLDVPGLGPRRPILWTVALAPSGSSKTLAAEWVAKTLAPIGASAPVQMFPVGGTDAQWIIDLKENNGSYWFQDEVGQFLKAVLSQGNYARIKPWILDAYSNKPIANRLKGEESKLEVEDPHFTFLGLTVRETWGANVDLASMLDGLCQRFNYVIAQPRDDTDMFDHFLYFTGDKKQGQQDGLRELWSALCAQPNANGDYSLAPETLPFLEEWWRGLRPAWGNSALPSSFIRRIGFSVLSYLVVIHFLLGLSRQKIGIETAEIATRFAEYHMECALVMIREYDCGWRYQIQTVCNAKERLQAKGNANPKARDISRALSTKARQTLNSEAIAEILDLLAKVEKADAMPLFKPVGQGLADELFALHCKARDQADDREEWRNQKRLSKLLRAFQDGNNATQNSTVQRTADIDEDCNVLDFAKAASG